jgi:hypothetical protein
MYCFPLSPVDALVHFVVRCRLSRKITVPPELAELAKGWHHMHPTGVAHAPGQCVMVKNLPRRTRVFAGYQRCR